MVEYNYLKIKVEWLAYCKCLSNPMQRRIKYADLLVEVEDFSSQWEARACCPDQ
jgi:hypothetical protein